jgi:hypothetical protein
MKCPQCGSEIKMGGKKPCAEGRFGCVYDYGELDDEPCYSCNCGSHFEEKVGNRIFTCPGQKAIMMGDSWEEEVEGDWSWNQRIR